jgi:hypothetical protein
MHAATYKWILDSVMPSRRHQRKPFVVTLGIANSRMKDFFDLWVLTRHSELDTTTLRRAITATFARRGTALPTNTPIGLSDEFIADRAKQTQWRAFTTRNQLTAPGLQVIVPHLRRFLESLLGKL